MKRKRWAGPSIPPSTRPKIPATRVQFDEKTHVHFDGPLQVNARLVIEDQSHVEIRHEQQLGRLGTELIASVRDPIERTLGEVVRRLEALEKGEIGKFLRTEIQEQAMLQEERAHWLGRFVKKLRGLRHDGSSS